MSNSKILNPLEKAICELTNASKQHPLYENIKKTNGKIVIMRGQHRHPEYLFIGEAPGRGENQVGLPFIGKSGKLLDVWLKETDIANYTVINAVPMIPLDAFGNIRAPTDDEINYFRPYIINIIKCIKPKRIVCLGKSSAKFFKQELIFKSGDWHGRFGYIYHPSFFLRKNQTGATEFKALIAKSPRFGQVSKQANVEYVTELEYQGVTQEDAVNKFLSQIGAQAHGREEFTYHGERWFIDYHPFEHSDDIIVHESLVEKYDKVLLVKVGGDRVRIPGWTDRKQLMSTPKRDIYRDGKYYYVVFSAILSNLSFFRIPKEKQVLLKDFVINQQEAENLGHSEMISGILAGLHFFAKRAKVYFRDINQVDECIIGNKKVKIYRRDAFSDEDMLIHESYFQKHPEIDAYVCCKASGDSYRYIGYIDKNVVNRTRTVQMIGQDSTQVSDDIRRIFSDQYGSLSKLLPIYDAVAEDKRDIKQQCYVPLHCHSEYSVGDAFGTTKYIAQVAYEKGFRACALTDHATLAGTWEFQKHMLERGIKPILGCEMYIKMGGEYEHVCHITLLVKNKKGWQNLLRLQSMGTRKHYYYRPIIELNELFQCKEGLIALSGCSDGMWHNLIGQGRYSDAEDLLVKFKQEFGADFYVEIQPCNVVGTRAGQIFDNQKILHQLHTMANEYGVKCVFTTDSHYPRAGDKEFQEAVRAIALRKPYGVAGFSDNCFYLMEEQDIRARVTQSHWQFPYLETLLETTNEVADKCSFRIEASDEKDTLPEMQFVGMTKAEKLRQMCIAGLEKNTPYKYDGRAKERLDMEMKRFLDKGYENYFLIVADLIKHAKDVGIMYGPGRGSVGSSLCAYALGITQCDPIKYDLLFDRFISDIRKDAPDIDMDFMDVRRDEVFEYLKQKYGENHCAKIVTYARFHPKSVLRDIGRIFHIPASVIEKICNLVIVRSGGDARSSFSLMDTFAEFAVAKAFAEQYPQASRVAVRLEGHIRHKGVHAGGMVISRKDIASYVPITKVKGTIVTEWEKGLVEDMNLVKFDILALRTLTILDDCIKSTGVKLPQSFDDVKVFNEVFRKGRTAGIFQLDTVGMTKFIQSLDIECFSDLYDATTLFRPGALHSGQAMTYVNNKKKRKIEYMHPKLEAITKSTRGVIMYQEQIMQIMYDIGAMSWATAEMARKVITKSKGKDAFNKVREEFVRNANRIHGMQVEEAEKLYDVVSTFGSYSFNKTHAIEYSMISYWCAWFKVYYPLHFYKAILKYETDVNVVNNIIREAGNMGIQVEYPDINKSQFSYELVDGKIYAGLNAVVGVGDQLARRIIRNRPYHGVDDFQRKCQVPEKVFKGLIVADVFRSFKINKKRHYVGNSGSSSMNLIQLFSGVAEVHESTDDFSDAEWARLMYEYTTLKPKLDIFRTFDFGHYPFQNISGLDKNMGETRKFLRGIVTAVVNKDKLVRADIGKHIHKFQRRMLYLNLHDGTGNIACQVNPATYEKYSKELQVIVNQPVVVYGTLSRDSRKMYVDMLQIVDLQNRTYDIDRTFQKVKALNDGEAVIVSAQPAVSRKGNSFYRVVFHDGKAGLLFHPSEKLFPGMKVIYQITQEPFIDKLNVIG